MRPRRRPLRKPGTLAQAWRRPPAAKACIDWHRVATLLPAVPAQVFADAGRGAPGRAALIAHHRRQRDGLGGRKTAAEGGDPHPLGQAGPAHVWWPGAQ